MNCVILHNIVSPYKTLLFNALHRVMNNLKILYISETELNREWVVNRDGLEFSYEIMFSEPADRVKPMALAIETWRRLHIHDPRVLVIDGYSYASCWAGFVWAKTHGKKVVLWSSSNQVDHSRCFIKEALKWGIVKHCDAFNVYGTKSKDYLVKLGAKENRLSLVGNNTDNSFYYEQTAKWRKVRENLRAEYGAPQHNFIYVGRFSAEKNIFALLSAFREVQERCREWGLILVGDGPQRNEIERYIGTNGIRRVALPGFKQRGDVPKYLAMSDVFVLPSISEPWGIVVNEAMAAGLPVLVSNNCGCYPDIVKDDRNGFSFNPLNGGQLTGLLMKMASNECDLKAMERSRLGSYMTIRPDGRRKSLRQQLSSYRAKCPPRRDTAKLAFGKTNGYVLHKQRIKRSLAGLLKYFLSRKRVSGLILNYHSVNQDHPSAVRPEAFSSQLKYLADHFKVISLDAFLEDRMRKSVLPG